MEKIKLLAIDLDGTTLTSKSRLSKKNREAILRAFENGIEVVIASGRPYQGLPKPFYSLPFNYMVLKNGGLVYDVKNKREIYHDIINGDDVYDVLKFLTSQDGIVQAEYDTYAYREKRNGELMQNWGNKLILVDDLAQYIKDNNLPIDKMFISCKDKEALKDVMKYQEKNINVTFMDVGWNCVDVCSRMCSKAFGLKKLAQELNIEKGNIAAIGDSDNDMLMLSYSGLSFAPKNGDEFLKGYVDVITPDNDHNALAYAIDYIIERNKKVK